MTTLPANWVKTHRLNTPRPIPTRTRNGPPTPRRNSHQMPPPPSPPSRGTMCEDPNLTFPLHFHCDQRKGFLLRRALLGQVTLPTPGGQHGGGTVHGGGGGGGTIAEMQVKTNTIGLPSQALWAEATLHRLDPAPLSHYNWLRHTGLRMMVPGERGGGGDVAPPPPPPTPSAVMARPPPPEEAIPSNGPSGAGRDFIFCTGQCRP